MTEEEAKCIVVSVWEAKSYLEKEHTLHLNFRTDRDGEDDCPVEIKIHKNYRSVFAHSWQTGDTLDSFIEGFSTRFNLIFGLND